jgi:magnesium transporter
MTAEIKDSDLELQFLEIIQTDNASVFHEFLDSQNISDVAELVNEFPDHEAKIISNLSVHRAVSTFKILDFPTQKRIIQELSAQKTAELLNALPADDRTSFLEDLPSEVVKELIKTLNPDERKITLSLLGYPEDSVGRLMTPDYIAVQKDWTVRQVIRHIRSVGKDSETIDVIYVVDDKGVFIDDIRIREIILADPDKIIENIIDNRYIALNVNDDQEAANKAFKMNNRVALPVLDNNKVLLGIITIDDVLWIANEEFSEDIQKIGGAEALGEPYLEIKFPRLIKKRVGWLIILFLSEMLTTTAMQFFNVELGKALVLGIFIPLTISAGGNSGSQASTLIIRAMALGEITLADWWRILRREFLSGFTLGLVLGAVGFLRIELWQALHLYNYGVYHVKIANTIFLSLIGIVLWGSVIGSMLPILLRRLGLDPATSSAPFVATLVDVTGIIIYFSVAYLILHGTLL